MVDFKGLIVKFVIISLMVISLFSFFIIAQHENQAQQPLTNNAVFNTSFNQLESQIVNNTRDAEEKYDVFNSEDPKAGFGSIVLFGIVSVGKTFSGMVFGTFIAVIQLPLVILGIPATIYNLLIVMLVIVVIIGVWLLYKLGG